ncbi:hypothetical protein M8J75_002665 [Diaphorina citri]|nr:hypothetical protein M8J75_002665 [Diaphorina citri]
MESKTVLSNTKTGSLTKITKNSFTKITRETCANGELRNCEAQKYVRNAQSALGDWREKIKIIKKQIQDNKKALCEEKEYYFGHSASPSSIHHKHKLQVQYCFSPLAPKMDSKCSNEALTDDKICKPKINGKIAAITNNCIDKICKPKLSCKCSNTAMTDR